MDLETLLIAAIVAAAGTSSPVLARTGSDTATVTQTRYYVDADVNNNGILDRNEFTTYVYRRWDRDNDGFLSDEEWELSAVNWYRPYDVEYKTYTFWDKDADGRLDPNEFETLISETRLYGQWDRNGNNILERDEYAEALFSMYDDNNDGRIDVEEWKNSLL